MNHSEASFLEKLIDWKDFELFVSDIYKDSEKVTVEHNVTLIGKSNARRQIDVLVTQKTKLHIYKTIIECKLWKKPVTRQTIDILFASVEDLNANKGVIFTTKGYEEGAIEYAKSKNIDIFIVRDIRDDEFGNLGRSFSLYLQMFSGKLENFKFENIRWFSPLGLPLTKQPEHFVILFTKEQEFPENQQLVNLDKKKGSHLVKLLIDIRKVLLNQIFKPFNSLLQPEFEAPEIGYRTPVKLDFSNYNYKFINHDNGFIELSALNFDFVCCISQSKMTFDRTASVDFALIVENFISKERNFVSKLKDESKIVLSEPIADEIIDESKLVNPNDIIKVATEHYVNFEFKKETKILTTNLITVNIVNE